MYLTIIALPLISFLIAVFAGRFIGNYSSTFFSSFCLFLAFIFSIIGFIEVTFCNSPCFLCLTNWVSVDVLVCDWSFQFDPITSIMLVVVTFVSSLVHLYSIEYMAFDPHKTRFIGYLSLFTFFMLVLVSADNFLLMFFGWEGIGLSSFLLISFWFTRIQTGKSAIKAMVVNRVGDLGLVLGLATIFLIFKSFDYSIVFSLLPLASNWNVTFLSLEFDSLTISSCFLVIGVIGKSSQLGLHTWLGDAMEGPTPVSALIHAATLVTAGVFLIIRCSSLFEFSPLTLNIVAIIGGLTAFFASTIGLVQNDIKKVIAYSTCSQLGYMVFICGLSHYSIALFHLANHALFKALLFLGAGSVIHGLSDEQDFRKMGGLLNSFPVTSSSIFIGSIAIMGVPFYTGFFSKDLILESAFAQYSLIGYYAYIFGCFAAFCTAFYSTRLFLLIFVRKTGGVKKNIEKSHEPGFLMLTPLLILSIGSVVSGYFFKDIFSGFGSSAFQSSIFVLYKSQILDSEFLGNTLKQLPLFFSSLGVAASAYFSVFSKNVIQIKTGKFKKIYFFLLNKWNFDQIYNEFFLRRIMLFGYKVNLQTIDKGVIEIFGPAGFSNYFLNLSKNLSRFNTGQITNTLLFMFFSINFVIIIIFFDLTNSISSLSNLFLVFSSFLFLQTVKKD